MLRVFCSLFLWGHCPAEGQVSSGGSAAAEGRDNVAAGPSLLRHCQAWQCPCVFRSARTKSFSPESRVGGIPAGPEATAFECIGKSDGCYE